MKADFTGSVKPGSELAPPLTDDIACLGLIGSVLTSRIQGDVSKMGLFWFLCHLEDDIRKLRTRGFDIG